MLPHLIRNLHFVPCLRAKKWCRLEDLNFWPIACEAVRDGIGDGFVNTFYCNHLPEIEDSQDYLDCMFYCMIRFIFGSMKRLFQTVSLLVRLDEFTGKVNLRRTIEPSCFNILKIKDKPWACLVFTLRIHPYHSDAGRSCSI